MHDHRTVETKDNSGAQCIRAIGTQEDHCAERLKTKELYVDVFVWTDLLKGITYHLHKTGHASDYSTIVSIDKYWKTSNKSRIIIISIATHTTDHCP